MRLIISFAALLLSITFLQFSTGTVNPFDALSGLHLGFSQTQVGLLGTAHFLGFFIGCWWAPRLIGSIGHSRAFGAFAALGAISLIAHPLIPDPAFWAGLRIMSGLCIAGCYTVIEAWFSAKLTNEIRGRMMSIYRIVDISAASLAQMMIGFLEPASYVSYNLLGIVACACLLPLTLTTAKQPAVPDAPRLRPLKTILSSPLGVAGVIVTGVTSASMRTVVPVYGVEIGLSAIQIGYFLSTTLVGGALAQFPVGWLADKYDRRYVLIGLSIASFFACAGIVAFGRETITLVYVFAFLFGATTMPIFSVSAAHANDFVTSEEQVELNASLMLFFALGAVVSPLMASSLMQSFGPGALFAFISVAHLVLVAFGFWRMRIRPTVEERTDYTYTPRTSTLIGSLLKRNSD
ncbi:MAG: MFS transporter [Pseudomonadota bacterium]